MAERVRDLQPERDETREPAAIPWSREERKQRGDGAVAYHGLSREGANTCWTTRELQQNNPRNTAEHEQNPVIRSDIFILIVQLYNKH